LIQQLFTSISKRASPWGKSCPNAEQRPEQLDDEEDEQKEDEHEHEHEEDTSKVFAR